MDDFVSSSLPPQSLQSYQNPLVRRCNSICTSLVVPTKLTLQHQSSSSTSISYAPSTSSSTSSSSSSADFDLISIKPISYTSLKDLIPSVAINSPKSPAGNQSQSGSEISIRNHLVKQAAWAYLQPMSTSPDSAGRSILHRLWVKLSCKNPVAALFSFFDRYVFRGLTSAFDWLFRTIRLRSFR